MDENITPTRDAYANNLQSQSLSTETIIINGMQLNTYVNKSVDEIKDISVENTIVTSLSSEFVTYKGKKLDEYIADVVNSMINDEA